MIGKAAFVRAMQLRADRLKEMKTRTHYPPQLLKARLTPVLAGSTSPASQERPARSDAASQSLSTASVAVHASTAAADPAVAAPAEVAAAMDLLDQDEIIQLWLKPSLWYIPLVSLAPLGAIAGVTVAAVVLGMSAGWPAARVVLQVCVLAAIVAVATAAMRWASRLYVLTNRRVMCFHGMMSVRLAECRLDHISDVKLHIQAHERPLRLGTIRMIPARECGETVEWLYISRPAEIHDIVTRAIRRAR